MVKHFEDFGIKMILMEVTAKDNYLFFSVERGQFTPVIVENIVAVAGFNQKATVVDIGYFNDITCIL